MNLPKKLCLNVSRAQPRDQQRYFSELPTAVAVLCLTFLSFVDCSKLSTLSSAFLAMTATAQSLMKTADQNLGPQHPSPGRTRGFLTAMFKKCSPHRLSSIISKFPFSFHAGEEHLKQIMDHFSKIQTLQMSETLFRRLHRLKSPKLFHKINALSIGDVYFLPDLSSICPGITTLTLSFMAFNYTPLMRHLVKLECLSTLTLQGQVGRVPLQRNFGTFIQRQFRYAQTTPFKSLKRLNLGEGFCSNLQAGWELIGPFAPQLEEMHIYFPFQGGYWLERGLRNLRLKICSIHFHCSRRRRNVYTGTAAKRKFMRRLSDPQMLSRLERLVVTNVTDEMVESISTTRHGVIVNRDCPCEILGANPGSSDYFE